VAHEFNRVTQPQALPLAHEQGPAHNGRARRRCVDRGPRHVRDVHQLGASGAANRLSVGATGLAPGDTMERAVDVINNGTLDMASVTLATSATTSSLLDTDTTNGLQTVIDKCTTSWTESGPPYTYTCGGTLTNVITTTPVIQSALGLGALASGATTHYRVKLTFPSGAGNTLQNQSSTIQYSFTGTQRTATSK
jgi:hypothetical protein